MINIETAIEVVNKSHEVNQLRQRIGNNRYSLSRQPTLSKPVSRDPVIKALAPHVGIPEFELELLVREILMDYDSANIEDLRRLFMLAKLKYSTPSIRYGEAVKQFSEAYERELEAYNKAKERDAEMKQKLTDLLNAEGPALDMVTSWKNTVDEIEAVVEAAEYKYSKLDAEHKQFLDFLNVRSKHMQIDAIGDTITIDFPMVRKFHTEHIAGTLRGWIKLKESERA